MNGIFLDTFDNPVLGNFPAAELVSVGNGCFREGCEIAGRFVI